MGHYLKLLLCILWNYSARKATLNKNALLLAIKLDSKGWHENKMHQNVRETIFAILIWTGNVYLEDTYTVVF